MATTAPDTFENALDQAARSTPSRSARAASLLLESLAVEDRDWMLAHLSTAARHRLDEADADPVDAPPAASLGVHAATERLRRCPDNALLKVLEREPPELAAVVLAQMPPRRRAQLERRLPTTVRWSLERSVERPKALSDRVLLSVVEALPEGARSGFAAWRWLPSWTTRAADLRRERIEGSVRV